MRVFNLVGCVMAVGLAGCSHYPVPDDVTSALVKTEDIVLYARCEMRSAILQYLFDQGTVPRNDSGDKIKKRIEEKKAALKTNEKLLSEKDKQLIRLAKVSTAYTFDFNITEHNTAGGGIGFYFPWTANALDAKASATLDLTRTGSRVFGAEDDWNELITDDQKCAEHSGHRQGSILHPITGSIGVGPAVKSFIEIEKQGGAKDNFVDTLTFTTIVGGGADAALRLEPVSNQFRLVTASAGVSASRTDIHKMTISIAFPKNDPRAITDAVLTDGYLNAPFDRPAPWRARYNLCVQDARSRENAFRQLRHTAPEVYCISYADEFAPEYGYKQIQIIKTRSGSAQPPNAVEPAARVRATREIITRPVRTNLRPIFQ